MRRFPPVRFANRREAGQQLAEKLSRFAGMDPLVLALPRGGVPVAFEIARALTAPLDLLLVRKLGAPGNPEYAIGAVVDGADPQVVLDETSVHMILFAETYVAAETKRQLTEIERRRRAYLGDRAPLSVKDRTVIVVDDGIATGSTAKAALRALRKAGAGQLVLAVPVAPAETLGALADEVDDIVCLETPEPFLAVGEHYDDFTQTAEGEVIALLREAKAFAM